MTHERVRDAVRRSIDLCRSGQREEALVLMDEVITETMKEGEESWAFLLIRHAAALSGGPDRALLRHYFELYLTHHPENPRALYALADLAADDGQAETAREHANRCYQALLQTSDQKAKRDLLDLVRERWPEVVR